MEPEHLGWTQIEAAAQTQRGALTECLRGVGEDQLVPFPLGSSGPFLRGRGEVDVPLW